VTSAADGPIEPPVRAILAALDALATAGDRSVAELSVDLGVPTGVAGEGVTALEDGGAVERTGDGRCRLGSKMAELGRLAGAARLDPAGRPA